VALVSNTSRSDTTHIDDVGFITSVVGQGLHTTNVIDPNAHSLIQATSTANAGQTDQSTFAANASSAYTNSMGGVVSFDVSNDALTGAPAVVATYGSGKRLTINLTGSSSMAISPLAPPSGTTGVINCPLCAKWN
jgi:hypothetical protein